MQVTLRRGSVFRAGENAARRVEARPFAMIPNGSEGIVLLRGILDLTPGCIVVDQAVRNGGGGSVEYGLGRNFRRDSGLTMG